MAVGTDSHFCNKTNLDGTTCKRLIADGNTSCGARHREDLILEFSSPTLSAVDESVLTSGTLDADDLFAPVVELPEMPEAKPLTLVSRPDELTKGRAEREALLQQADKDAINNSLTALHVAEDRLRNLRTCVSELEEQYPGYRESVDQRLLQMIQENQSRMRQDQVIQEQLNGDFTERIQRNIQREQQMLSKTEEAVVAIDKKMADIMSASGEERKAKVTEVLKEVRDLNKYTNEAYHALVRDTDGAFGAYTDGARHRYSRQGDQKREDFHFLEKAFQFSSGRRYMGDYLTMLDNRSKSLWDAPARAYDHVKNTERKRLIENATALERGLKERIELLTSLAAQKD